MSTSISTNYRELQPDEIQRVADECAEAWKDFKIPMRQFDIVKAELDTARREPVSHWCAPYKALVDCLYHIPGDFFDEKPRLLDVGASSGYYREVLRIAGYPVRYTAVDSSRAFQRFVQAIYPDMVFDVADARRLPYHDDMFDIVLSSACIMHNVEYAQVIRETARVASRYAIFHRTPILDGKPTSYFLKEGYGVPMIEVHFSEPELLGLFDDAGLQPLFQCDVFRQEGFGHRSYLLQKKPGLNHVQV